MIATLSQSELAYVELAHQDSPAEGLVQMQQSTSWTLLAVRTHLDS